MNILIALVVGYVLGMIFKNKTIELIKRLITKIRYG